MLEPIKHFLKAQRVILASGSPRRKDILERNLVLYYKKNKQLKSFRKKKFYFYPSTKGLKH
jgi:predicted house-cleaning NTP pyrophosphatase (Maf/HAM1 superfamily)